MSALQPRPLVTAAWLHAEQQKNPQELVIADVRWYLGSARGHDAYRAGHIPGACFVDLDVDLAARPGESRPGRHPLPDAAAFAAFLARIGVGPDSLVVGYDDVGGATAARLWWLLDYFGHSGGRILDGGIQAWTHAGYALETAVSRSVSAPPLALVAQPGRVTDRAGVAAALEQGDTLLIDARAAERFEGRVEPIDARAGHIPGAVNVPFIDNLQQPGGAFRSPEELRARYRAAGVEPPRKLIAYCGSGVTACHDVLALRLIGHDAVLYEGSWSDWASDPALPLAKGG